MRTVQTAGPATSLTAAASERQELVTLTQQWPDRAKTPSVRDIIAFRQTLPSHVPPEKVGDLAGARFRWNQEKTLTSEKYVQGVVAAHDQTKRALLDELKKYFEEKPTSAEDALQRWGWISQWVHSQPRPSTPKQTFED